MKHTKLANISATLLLSLDIVTVNHLADAIYRAEGSDRTRYPYGIKSVTTDNPRFVCINTIKHAWKDFERQTKKQYVNTMPRIDRGTVTLPFIQFLGQRYCPESVDRVGYRNWTNNVWRIYNAKSNP